MHCIIYDPPENKKYLYMYILCLSVCVFICIRKRKTAEPIRPNMVDATHVTPGRGDQNYTNVFKNFVKLRKFTKKNINPQNCLFLFHIVRRENTLR